MRKKIVLFVSFIATNVGAFGADIVVNNDSILSISLSEIYIEASPKENATVQRLPLSASVLGRTQLAENQVVTTKDLSSVAPNFFMPDYGSSLTSAIYIRGVGSRINTPAVGLYVDDVPYIDKSSFAFNFIGVESIDVLRGPQSTLYGRNTMGGLVHIHTTNPFGPRSTTLRLGAAAQNEQITLQLSHHGSLNQHVAVLAEGFFNKNNGFFRNDFLGENADASTLAGGRLRSVVIPADNLKVDMSVSYEYTHENGYPYEYCGVASGDEQFPDLIGKITSNRENGYRRSMFNAAVKILSQSDKITFTSVTGFQGLSDHMIFDQDFLPTDTFGLDQYQHQHTLTQEFILKNRCAADRWQWTLGAFGYRQWLRIESPVRFNRGGVQMIQQAMDKAMRASQSAEAPDYVRITDDEMLVPGDFDNPSMGAAIYHQSSVGITDKLSVTVGARVDYERYNLDYLTGATIGCDIGMNGTVVHGRNKIWYSNSEQTDYLKFLPKIALLYRFDKSNTIFASVTNGYRSGGYNVQMFADIISTSFQNGSKISDDEVGESVEFDPEICCNYELGTRLLLGGYVHLDASVFYMDMRHQQIAKFAEGGLGRRVTNAGRSRSAGGELSVAFSAFAEKLSFRADYGYTRSEFVEYSTVVDNRQADYEGNFVPFVPRQTCSATVSYAFVDNAVGTFRRLSVGMNASATGRIYWNEENSALQHSYAVSGAFADAQFGKVAIHLWAKNIFNEEYSTFSFESMNHRFVQRGKPFHLGVEVTVRF
ncbi:MAG: TonB-dependent receptor [Bacteroidales bacterium]|nr:TonB-dependent receptor [Bacteroidales bacterium]